MPDQAATLPRLEPGRIERMRRDHLFLVPMDGMERQGWYRCHPLLRDLLRQRTSLLLWVGRTQRCYRRFAECHATVNTLREQCREDDAEAKAKAKAKANWVLLAFSWALQEDDIATARTLLAAWKMGTFGNKPAHVDVSAIELVAAQLKTRVMDRAMRFFDGPDEAHLRTPARVELAKARENLGATAPYYNVH